MKPYPLVFEPILKEKVWGGRALESLGKALPGGASVGESWEVADLGSTSADGGGGDAAHSVIINGEMRGMRLDEAVRAMGPTLLGHLRLTDSGGFPLLVKFLDARENLSVQVHPSEAYAAAHAGAHLKTESWYVVRAEPGAKIYKGVRAGVSREEFADRIGAGTVEEVLIAHDARPGDVHHLPSGVCHALGAGVVVAEVQTPSDTTFRVYDWGRTGRALHVEPALECIDFAGELEHPATRSDGSERCGLVKTGFYELAEVRGRGGEDRLIDTHEDLPVVWMVLCGSVRLESVRYGGSGGDAAGEGFETVELGIGTTCLIPAKLDGVRAVFDRDSSVLEVRFPAP